MEATVKKPVVKRPDPEDPAAVLTFEDLQQIGRLCHKNIQDKEQLFEAVTELATIDVQGVQITLDPKLLARVKTRCLNKGDFPGWLKETVIRQLHDFAGW